nr:hypothetical protein [Tanacetum cinerariifolium]
YLKDSGFELTAFLDADHAGCHDTGKSTSRGIQFLDDKLVRWMLKKQDCTAMSSAEAEYVSLSTSWKMTFFLGLHVNQSPSGIFINHSKYVHEILNKYGLNTCDIVGTPMDIKDKLDLDQIGTPVDATKYRSMIGALMYLTSSRLDIVHATCYLKDSGFELTAFLDADHAGCHDTRKSTSRGIQFLDEKLVRWMLKKQDCTAMSSAEAEYMSLSTSCAQCYNLIPAESDSLPYAHTQTTKTYYKHQYSRIKNAQELKTKTLEKSDIKDPSSETKLQERLLESFQEDAKYEHVCQDTRSQDDKDDKDKQEKVLKILEQKTKSKDNEKYLRSKIT